jgi:hypothetical protein
MILDVDIFEDNNEFEDIFVTNAELDVKFVAITFDVKTVFPIVR